MEAVIEAINLYKNYTLGKTTVTALRGVNLTVYKSEIVCICGPSGSGKTTLLNLIGCLDRLTAGTVKILNKDVAALSDEQLSKLRNRYIGFIFQTFNLIPVLTAYENVEYPLVIAGVGSKERRKKVNQILSEVGLIDYRNHKPGELSGGQQQRVAIARALVTNPEIVLADEPTANLDSKTGLILLELLNKINKERSTTFVFSTHDHKILSYASKIYYLRDGEISLREA